MVPALTLDGLARLETASRTLLSALAFVDADAWRQEAAHTVRRAVGADHAVFGVAALPTPVVVDGLNPAVWAAYAAYFTTEEGAYQIADPVIARWMAIQRHAGHGAFSAAGIDRALQPHGLTLADSPLMQEVARPNGLHGLCGLTATCGGGEAGLQVSYSDAQSGDRQGAEAEPLLRALLPSFRAGMDAFYRLDGQRQALDAVAEPLAVFGTEGRERYRNPALAHLMEAEGERGRLEADLAHLARGLARLAFPVGGRPAQAPPPVRRETRTAQARYCLQGALLPAGAFGPGETLMVTVVPAAPPPRASHAAARARFGFTRREAEVAALLAEGLKNDAVAGRLFISPATARRHTEGVLGKLAVSSRSAVASRLLMAA